MAEEPRAPGPETEERGLGSSGPEPHGPWAIARATLGRDLDAEERSAQPELAAQNLTRFLTLAPLLLLAHGAAIVGALPWGRWGEPRSIVFAVHAATVACCLGLIVAALGARRRGARPGWFGDVVVLLYAAFGLAIATNAQRMTASSDLLSFSLFFTAVLFRARLVTASVAYLGSAGIFWVALELLQPDVTLRWELGSTTTAVALIAFGFSRLLVTSDLREVSQRRVIAVQRDELEVRKTELEARKAELEARKAELEARQDELERLNETLERKVEDQLGEILQRSAEVESLDAQLRVKVRDRAKELAKALRDAPPRTDEPLRPGVLFAGRVTIRRLLGAGGMGEVYLGDDAVTGRAVAVKRMRADIPANGGMLSRFVAEASAVAAVDHPGVVRCLHVDLSDEGGLYHLMEYVKGISLQEAVGPRLIDLGTALRFGAGIASVLAAAHEAGVVHRDIKPANIMLTANAPGLRVLDFGISKLHDEPTGATGTGQIVGTPRYMAPEQFHDNAHITGATDVYALGAVLYELIAGNPPFGGGALFALIKAHLEDTPPPLELANPSVPPGVAILVARCLAKKPADRPTAAEVERELSGEADAMGVAPSDELAAKLARAGRLRAAFDFDTVAHELAHAIARPPAPARPSVAPTVLKKPDGPEKKAG